MTNTQAHLDESGRLQFLHKGFTYRTNATASFLEGRDGESWGRTHSLNVREVAQQALAQKTQTGLPYRVLLVMIEHLPHLKPLAANACINRNAAMSIAKMYLNHESLLSAQDNDALARFAAGQPWAE